MQLIYDTQYVLFIMHVQFNYKTNIKIYQKYMKNVLLILLA